MWTINKKDLYSTFGARILKDSYNDIMSPPKPRPRLEYDFPDQTGLAVDMVSPLSYEARTFKMNVLLVGTDADDFWTKYLAFFEEIATPGAFALYIADLGVTVSLLYEGAKCLKKPRSLQSGRVAVSYEITVKEYDPSLRIYDIDNDEGDDDDD
jgi:hypothetical protein